MFFLVQRKTRKELDVVGMKMHGMLFRFVKRNVQLPDTYWKADDSKRRRERISTKVIV